MTFKTKLAAAAVALSLTGSAFAFESKMIALEKIPAFAELLQVRDLGLDLFFAECLYPLHGTEDAGTDYIFRKSKITLPAYAATETSGFKFLDSVDCLETDAVDGHQGTDIGTVGAQVDTALCVRYTYGADIGPMSSQEVHLCAIGSDGNLIIADTTDDGVDATQVPINGGTVLDFCVAFSADNADAVKLQLGTEKDDTDNTEHRNFENMIGFDYCGSGN